MEAGKKNRKKYLKQTIAKNFPNFIKMNLQIQKFIGPKAE